MNKNNTDKTILIVEDDYCIREIFKEVLEIEDYNVVTANNGLEGLKKIRQQKPNLVLLDMMMPIMNGREFLNVVLADGELAPIPVIVVSASADNKSAQGARAFLNKPTDLHTLLDLVAENVDHQSAS